eukprot:scaffold113668_cov22-Tisochrysis_lutea.AAC.2
MECGRNAVQFEVEAREHVGRGTVGKGTCRQTAVPPSSNTMLIRGECVGRGTCRQAAVSPSNNTSVAIFQGLQLKFPSAEENFTISYRSSCAFHLCTTAAQAQDNADTAWALLLHAFKGEFDSSAAEYVGKEDAGKAVDGVY